MPCAFDEEIVSGTPPELFSANVLTTVVLFAMVPKAIEVGTAVNLAGASPTPVRDTETLPPVLFTTSEPPNVPAAVGLKVSVAVNVAPTFMVAPVAGAPVAVKGAGGLTTELMVSGRPPLLVNRTDVHPELSPPSTQLPAVD